MYGQFGLSSDDDDTAFSGGFTQAEATRAIRNRPINRRLLRITQRVPRWTNTLAPYDDEPDALPDDFPEGYWDFYQQAGGPAVYEYPDGAWEVGALGASDAILAWFDERIAKSSDPEVHADLIAAKATYVDRLLPLGTDDAGRLPGLLAWDACVIHEVPYPLLDDLMQFIPADMEPFSNPLPNPNVDRTGWFNDTADGWSLRQTYRFAAGMLLAPGNPDVAEHPDLTAHKAADITAAAIGIDPDAPEVSITDKIQPTVAALADELETSGFPASAKFLRDALAGSNMASRANAWRGFKEGLAEYEARLKAMAKAALGAGADAVNTLLPSGWGWGGWAIAGLVGAGLLAYGLGSKAIEQGFKPKGKRSKLPRSNKASRRNKPAPLRRVA